MKKPGSLLIQGSQKAFWIFGVCMSVVFIWMLSSCEVEEHVSNPVRSSIPTAYQTSQPSEAAVPTPMATPKPSALIIAEMEEELEQTIRQNISLDVESMLPIEEGTDWFSIKLSDKTKNQWILSIQKHVSDAISQAAQKTISMAPGRGITFSAKLTAPSWQYLYTLILFAKDITKSSECIKSSLSIEVSIENGELGMLANVNVGPAYYRDAIRTVVGGNTKTYVMAETTYVYANTVFDENIKEKKYALPPAKGNLASGITWPLQQYTRLRKTWYAARDKGDRKHTGTDIWAPEGTEIYSCTDGTVFYIGYSDKGGNTVVIADDCGYMFYYHHMVRLTDFLAEGQRVNAGQLIGRVGNTGNSALNHLHLTIVNPDGILVNPYPYLLKVKPK